MHWFLKLFSILFAALFFWVAFSGLLPKVLPQEEISNKDINGLIIRNERWSGTIHIVGDLITTPGVTISVDPGTRIIVSKSGDKFNLDYLPWHLKSGLNTGPSYHGVNNGELFWDESQKIQIHLSKLIAIGTAQQPIILSSDASGVDQTPFDFNVFSVNEGVLSNLIASNYRRLEIGSNVTVRDSSFSNTGDCAVCIDHSDPSVINNTFKGGVREYIWDFGGSPRITDNLFLPSKGDGVVIDPDMDGAAIVSHNDFEMPFGEGLEFLTGDEDQGGVVSFNVFGSGSQIKIPCDSKVNIIENQIEGLVSFQTGGCKQTVTLGSNYWGINKIETVLAERVLQKDSNLTVLIPAILKTPPSGVGIRH